MTIWTILLSMVLGLLWHTVVMMLVREEPSRAFSWMMIAGVTAGICAGYLTLWSRRRNQGRESILWGVLTYYAAAGVYALTLVLLEVVDTSAGGQRQGLRVLVALSGMTFYYGFFAATAMGVFLIPLCFATRFVFWHLAGTTLPNLPRTPRTAMRRGREPGSRKR
jgi:hypothetical protein